MPNIRGFGVSKIKGIALQHVKAKCHQNLSYLASLIFGISYIWHSYIWLFLHVLLPVMNLLNWATPVDTLLFIYGWCTFLCRWTCHI